MKASLEERTACFTGHREINPDMLEHVTQELRREIEEAIADGYTNFVSGFAEGVDQLAAAIVLELKAEHPGIHLEAMIPYPGRLDKLYKDQAATALLHGCSGIGVSSEKYTRDCHMIRNRRMLSMSSRVIGVYDGRDKGGTVQTLRFAHAQGKEIREIRI